MSEHPTVWGVHMGAHVGDRPIEEGFVAIGWSELGDIRGIGTGREAFKAALTASGPEAKEGAIPVHAGVLHRFVNEMRHALTPDTHPAETRADV